MKKYSLLTVIGAVAIVNLLARLLGFFREVIIGYHFGTSVEADGIITAYTIPNFLYITAGGAITTAFISLYTKGNDFQQRELKGLIFTYTAIFFSIISVLFFVLPEFFISSFFRGLTAEETHLTSTLFRFMGLGTVFFVLSMYLSGLLNSHGKYQHSAWAPFLNNLLFVVIALIGYPLFGIQAYSFGAFIGAVGMYFLVHKAVKSFHLFDFKWRLKGTDHALVKRFFKISLPIFFGGATLQFYFLVHRIFASYLDAGILAALNYASKLVQLPQTILMTAVTTVIYPFISRKIAEKDMNSLSKLYTNGLSYMLFLMVPVTMFILFYSNELIKLVFEYGSFNASSTKITGGLFMIFSVGMFAHAANVFITRFFYATEKPLIPVLSGIIAVFGVNIVIVVSFINKAGAEAIAWGTTIAAYFQLVILMIWTRKSLHIHLLKYTNVIKIFVLLLLLLPISWVTKQFTNTLEIKFISIIIGTLVIGGSYLILAVLFKVKEVYQLPFVKRWLKI
ncbi:putative peptidoglycan lipid II flippase [Oikeobacillus pervagus]|uniref:Peptidoglycan lipid II flippase n=1 Tax=Oikeobacillus pervagus TaxID=1325931 RepID=A0AAJ1T177_9BACI|nr:murein biosynthesis integral membrane protein MurJ [Oikeobacillus pervagus]MDQ0215307.1 putative peptidoglycan lipid II flippase [Oikeobacillus pervagus]